LDIIINNATEAPFTGKYTDFNGVGSYLCRRCGKALFRSDNKFLSGCGWPSFDDELPGTIQRTPDLDGMRTEISCQRCGGHLGHVFTGEHLTDNNLRHCVNTQSIDFVADTDVIDSEEAIFAGGCFWGVEYHLQQLPGVLHTEVGYTGGNTQEPTYEPVCGGNTGHVEAIRVLYDPAIIDHTSLTKVFFELHDPTQTDGQGPDIGPQYLSRIFYLDAKQHTIAKSLIKQLQDMRLAVQTQLLPATIFWAAEDYHQQYYQKNGKQPYCHQRVSRFDKSDT
jgi:peptide methionine sulfoxide reductase msrA/msrB